MKHTYIRFSRIFIFLALLWSVMSVATGTAGKNDSRRSKARHFFLSGAVKDAMQEPDAAYELYKKAYVSDTTYEDAALYHGFTRFYVNNDSLDSKTESIRSLAMARKLIDLYPGDEMSVMQYAYLANLSDTTEEALRVIRLLDSVRPDNPDIMINLASVYAESGNLDSALSMVRKVERLDGISFQTTLYKVRLHLAKSDTAAVVSELSSLVEENPVSPEYALVKGKVLGMLGMQDSAIVYMEKAHRLDPEDGRIINEMAQAYGAMGESVTYDRLTYEALLSDDLQYEVKMEILRSYIGQLLRDRSDRSRGDRLFEVLTRQYPHEPSLLALAARYASSCGNYDEAIEKVSYAIDLNPTEKEYRQMLMSYYIISDRPLKAMEIYRKTLADIPTADTGDLDELYSAAAMTAGDYDELIDILNVMLRRICPSMSVTDSAVNMKRLYDLSLYDLYRVSGYFQQAGDAFYQTDSLPSAFRAYENAIAVFPDNLLAKNNYAYFLVEKGGARPGSERYDKAKEMSHATVEAMAGNPNPTYLDTYAWILHLEGDDEEALKYMAAAQAAIIGGAGDDSAEYHIHTGDILHSLGREEEAIQEWKKALELDPENAEAKSRLK